MTSLPDTAAAVVVDPKIEAAATAALATLRRNIEAFGLRYPDDTTVDGRYPVRPAIGPFAEGANRGWTTSFWPGMTWIAWETTGDAFFREAGLAHAADFARRLRSDEDLDTHDLGFLYTLAAVAPWRLLGDDADDRVRAAAADARAAALDAADRLMRRFLEPAGIVQAWGDLSDPGQRGRTIIDSLMNMPLLTWAGEQTGEPRFADAVRRHTTQLRENILRDDDTTFHTFYWDAETGRPLRGATEQGAFDDSCWARGQAWGIYGFAMNHRATGDPALLDASRRCADYFLTHLPADRVPFWDMVYSDGADAPRDSSSAAIAVTGLIELAEALEARDGDTQAAADAERYRAAAIEMLHSLIDGYTPATPDASDAVILHSVYDFPKSVGVDEGTLWGDYFYLESLTRAARPGWKPYW